MEFGPLDWLRETKRPFFSLEDHFEWIPSDSVAFSSSYLGNTDEEFSYIFLNNKTWLSIELLWSERMNDYFVQLCCQSKHKESKMSGRSSFLQLKLNYVFQLHSIIIAVSRCSIVYGSDVPFVFFSVKNKKSIFLKIFQDKRNHRVLLFRLFPSFYCQQQALFANTWRCSFQRKNVL